MEDKFPHTHAVMKYSFSFLLAKYRRVVHMKTVCEHLAIDISVKKKGEKLV